MRVKFSIILERRTVGRTVVRSLSCGHEQVEANGGRAHLAATARCFTCFPKPGFTPPSIPHEPPAGASVAKESPVVVVAQVKGIKCAYPTKHGALEPRSFQCDRCAKRICGHCEHEPKPGSPCDACWLEGVGVA